MQKVIQLKGLDCAHCAAQLESEIAKIDGVQFASVSFINQKLTIDYADEQALEKAVYLVNHFEEVSVVQERTENVKDGGRYAIDAVSHTKQWAFIAVSIVCFICGLVFEKWINNAVVFYIFYTLSYISAGLPVLKATVKNISKGKVFDENFLMTVASIGALCIGEISEGVAVMLLYQMGEILQSIAVQSSRNSVAELMDLKSEFATVLTSSSINEQRQVKPEEIAVGDLLLVKTGEKIPVDGILLSVNATLDTKALTGEPEYKQVPIGEKLLSGCINAGAVIKMQATKAYSDSAVSRILDMVENAASKKAKPEKFITKFAKIYTPIVCLAALAIAVFAPLIEGLIVAHTLRFIHFTRWLKTALTFLVISCPCALIISVPLTYFSGIGVAAKQGILVKGATYLDALATANTFAFDKTGTLTQGNFAICQVLPVNEQMDEQTLLKITAAVERNSAHPIARAFQHVKTAFKTGNVQEQAGLGLSCEIDGETVLVGSFEYLKENGVSLQPLQSIYTVIYVAKAGQYLGAIELGDKLREQTKPALEGLKSLGITQTVMLTGDNENRAIQIANEIGMYALNANLLPDEKLEKAEQLKQNGVLVYVGDGINDAPVMATADVSVSMGKLGSAAAVEASDLVLIADDLTALPKAVKIARKTRAIVKQNIVFSIIMKAAFMTLGVAGVLPLSLAVFADVGVMLIAVANSFRVKKTACVFKENVL